MDALKPSEVEQIALLARLDLSEEETERLGRELTTILSYMGSLQQVDTTDVEPMTHAVPMDLRLRDDEEGASLSVDEALAHAPDTADDSFRVPHIINK